MASITPTVEPDYLPPRVMLRVDASPGCLLRSCLVRRMQNGVLSSIRRQPPAGVDSSLCYDYESWYGVPCSYEATGLEQVQPLTAMWQGAVNSSESRLLDGGGNVIATNLATDPNAQRVFNFWQASGNLTANGMQCTINDGYDKGSVYPLSSSDTNSLPAGSYVEVVHIDNVAGVGSIGTDQMTGADNAQVQYSNGVAVVRFDSQGTISPNGLYIYLNPDGGCLLRHIGLYTAADWQAMQEAGITWFDGDYTRDASTQSYDVSSSPLTLSPDSGWLIHPGNPAKSIRLPMGYVTGIGNTTRRTNATRHDRLGARYPVYTIPGPRYSREYTLNLRTRGPDDEQMLLAATDDQTPLLIDWLHDDAQRLNMDPMYIQVGDISYDRYAQMLYPADASTPLWWRDWQLPCIEVDSPSVSQQAVGWTYAQLLSEQPTYQSVMDEYATYADLTARQGKDH